MQRFVNLREDRGIECLADIRQRFEQSNHENENMIAGMRTYSWHFW